MKRLHDRSLIDLMGKRLAIRMDERLTVEQTLAHPFFAEQSPHWLYFG
jgi:hypothetical protein